MFPANFNESTCLLNAPAGCESVIDPLPIERGTLDGIPVQVSCWKPTRAEVDAIERTGRVWLVVVGSMHPPVCLVGGDKPKLDTPADHVAG